MVHDVFISHASADKPVADAVCAKLELHGVRCWIAPRDILPGTDWGESIIDGISESKMMVLVFSSNANKSAQIKNEVERAVHKGIPIVPFRVEEVVPSKSLEYFISTPHWLDALSQPLEQHLNRLAETTKLLMSRLGNDQAENPQADAQPTGEPAHLAAQFCIECGTKLTLGDIFCIGCGNKILR